MNITRSGLIAFILLKSLTCQSGEYFQYNNSIRDSIEVKKLLAAAKDVIARNSSEALKISKEAHHISKLIDWEKGIALSLKSIGNALYMNDELDSALIYYEDAKRKLELLNDEYALCGLLSDIGNTYYYKSEYATALSFQEKSLGLSRKSNNLSGEAFALQNIGMIYRTLTDYPKAISYYFSSIPINEKIGNKRAVAITLNSIGILYNAIDDYENALLNYQNSRDLFLELGNDPGLVNVLNNIGTIYHSKKEYALAMQYFEESMSLYAAMSNRGSMISSMINIASVYEDQKEYRKAIDMLESSLRISKDIKSKNNEALVSHSLAKIYYETGDYNTSRKYANIALGIFKESNHLPGQRNVLLLFTKILEAEGKGIEALNYYRKHIELRDSINNAEKRTELVKSQLKYDFEKQRTIDSLSFAQEKELSLIKINRQNQQIRQSNKILIAVIIITLLLLIISIVSISSYRLIRKSRKELENNNILIAKALEERETLLREIHHRVKNNLQIISSILNLQIKNVKDEAAQGAVIESRNRVKSMSLIHEQLYRDENLSGIQVRSYIIELVESIRNSFARDAEEIKLEYDIDSIFLDVDTAIPLGLILNELICNILKHAFPEGRGGWIGVKLSKVNGFLDLSVADNGVGMNATEGIGSERSFGLSLIYTLAKKLKADIEIEKIKGTVFKFRIRDFKEVEYFETSH